MTNEQKIKQLKTIINYATLRLNENWHYSNALQVMIALKDTLEDKPISNGLDRIIEAYSKSNLTK